jgi:hypothetical protein
VTARAVDTATLPDDTIREAIEFIAANLRAADLDEVRATVGDVEPFWAIFESWEASVASWLIVDGTGLPIGIFGVAPHVVPKVGLVWLLGTDGLVSAGLTVARQTKHFVAEMGALYPALSAHVDARNTLSTRWLSWAGFNVIDADPAFGPEKRLFYHFVRTR